MNRREVLQVGAGLAASTITSRLTQLRAQTRPTSGQGRCEKLLTGSFLFVQHVNLWDGQYADESLTWGPANWKAIVQDMHDIGMDTLIWTNTAFWGRPLFPGPERKIGMRWRAMGCEDPLGVVAEEADRLGMKIFYGIGLRGRCSQVRDYAGLDKPWPESWFIWNTAMAEALVERYGSRPSFAGLYLSYEIDYHELHAELYEKLVKQHLRPAVGKVKLLASPGNLGREVPDSAALPKRIERSGVDILAPQDYGGRPGRLEPALALAKENAAAIAKLRPVMANMGVTLWANCETFDFESTADGRSSCIAGPMERIRGQIEVQADVADKLICYVYEGIMNRRTELVNIGPPSAPRLYRDYVAYLKSTFPGRFDHLV